MKLNIVCMGLMGLILKYNKYILFKPLLVRPPRCFVLLFNILIFCFHSDRCIKAVSTILYFHYIEYN